MNKIASTMKKLWKDESGQGTAEYILLLVAVVMVAFLFKNQIKEIVSEKLGELSKDIGGFTSQ
jgi:Flp pilus assembly pilin Flp